MLKGGGRGSLGDTQQQPPPVPRSGKTGQLCAKQSRTQNRMVTPRRGRNVSQGWSPCKFQKDRRGEGGTPGSGEERAQATGRHGRWDALGELEVGWVFFF